MDNKDEEIKITLQRIKEEGIIRDFYEMVDGSRNWLVERDAHPPDIILTENFLSDNDYETIKKKIIEAKPGEMIKNPI